MSNRAKARRGGWLLLAGCAAVLAASAGGAWGLRTWMRQQPASEDSAAMVRRGKVLYLAACLSCHGPEGHGDGSSAATLDPPPRDFAGVWKYGDSPEMVRKVIREGIPGTAMPSSPSLAPIEVESLTVYVRTLRQQGSPLSETMREALKKAGFVPVSGVLNPAPALEMREVSGQSQSLARLRGRVVLLNFWGTTCVHCLQEMPNLQRLNEELRDRGLTVVSVCFDEDDVTEVGKLARRYVRDLPVYVNPDGKAAVRYDVQVMPCLYLIDAQGRLVARAEGAKSWTAAELAPVVQMLGAEVPTR